MLYWDMVTLLSNGVDGFDPQAPRSCVSKYMKEVVRLYYKAGSLLYFSNLHLNQNVGAPLSIYFDTGFSIVGRAYDDIVCENNWFVMLKRTYDKNKRVTVIS